MGRQPHQGKARRVVSLKWARPGAVLGTTAAIVAIGAGLALEPATAAEAAAAETVTFSDTTASQDWLVPAGVRVVHVRAQGGSGANGTNVDGGIAMNYGGIGGLGGVIDTDLSVTPGQRLRIVVGARGTTDKPGSGAAVGGRSGFSNLELVSLRGAGNGGGSSAVLDGATVVVAAAGGGGGGSAGLGGGGGDGGLGGGGRGYAGKGSFGGAGGVGSGGANRGGAGGNTFSDQGGGGGGGGGGFWPDGLGGGDGGDGGQPVPFAGAPGGGGAGGRSWSAGTNNVTSSAAAPGSGRVTLSWHAVAATQATLASSLNPARIGEPVTFSVRFPTAELMPRSGLITFGTFNPATGVEMPQATWDLSVVPTQQAAVTWQPTQFPEGLTYVWASFSGSAGFAPWKSEYLMQVTAQRGEPNLVVTPTTVDFGEVKVGMARTLPLTLSNTGSATWRLASLALTDPAFRLTSTSSLSSCQVLDAGTTCRAWRVTFAPTTAGTSTGVLELRDNDGNLTTIQLVGRTPAAPQVSSVSPSGASSQSRQ